jgi:hypothetical protein
MGTIGDGVLLMLSVKYGSIYYDATFYYDAVNIQLTVSKELENLIGKIEEHSDYIDLIKKILNIVEPISIKNKLKPVNLYKYIY